MDKRINLLAHNIRSLWNVGSLFRTCDALGIEKLYLTGYTATPPRREISKTAIGAEEWVPWVYERDPLVVVQQMREEGWKIVSLEQTPGAIELSKYEYDGKLCLIVGNEIQGVPKDLLDQSDNVVCIPMYGKKESLNVAVAAGIALHHLRES